MPNSIDLKNALINLKIKKSINEIEKDILDRRGLKWKWSKINSEIKREIKKTWAKIIFANLMSATNK